MPELPNISDLLMRLNDPDYRGPAQHLRGWDDLDLMHDAAIHYIKQLQGIVLLYVDPCNVSLEHEALVTECQQNG